MEQNVSRCEQLGDTAHRHFLVPQPPQILCQTLVAAEAIVLDQMVFKRFGVISLDSSTCQEVNMERARDLMQIYSDILQFLIPVIGIRLFYSSANVVVLI